MHPAPTTHRLLTTEVCAQHIRHDHREIEPPFGTNAHLLALHVTTKLCKEPKDAKPILEEFRSIDGVCFVYVPTLYTLLVGIGEAFSWADLYLAILYKMKDLLRKRGIEEQQLIIKDTFLEAVRAGNVRLSYTSGTGGGPDSDFDLALDDSPIAPGDTAAALAEIRASDEQGVRSGVQERRVQLVDED